MLYIGNRPTIEGSKKNIEANIFKFNKEIYGESLSVHLHKFIREDRKFSDVEELTLQIKRDEEKSLQILSNLRKPKIT
jgi:riboflavin kinase/FMN adenylyltransferase